MVVPGKVLPPGTYVFRLAETAGTRNIVHIFDDKDNLVTTVVSVPKQRLEPTGELALELAPAPDGGPPVLTAWFYPGKVLGHEFVYSNDEARRAASASQGSASRRALRNAAPPV